MAHQVGGSHDTDRKRLLALTVGRHDEMKDLRCMSFTSKGTAEIIAAGWQDTMLVIDLIKGDVVKQVSSVP
jgi:PAB-dependent poly(A)-specific ribonuclease subunit 2